MIISLIMNSLVHQTNFCYNSHSFEELHDLQVHFIASYVSISDEMQQSAIFIAADKLWRFRNSLYGLRRAWL